MENGPMQTKKSDCIFVIFLWASARRKYQVTWKSGRLTMSVEFKNLNENSLILMRCGFFQIGRLAKIRPIWNLCSCTFYLCRSSCTRSKDSKVHLDFFLIAIHHASAFGRKWHFSQKLIFSYFSLSIPVHGTR